MLKEDIIEREEMVEQYYQEPKQNRLGLVNVRMNMSGEASQSGHQYKTWCMDKEKLRNEKLDRMASDILTPEAMKLITKAYEIVFEGKRKQDVEENKSNLEDKEARAERKKHIAMNEKVLDGST